MGAEDKTRAVRDSCYFLGNGLPETYIPFGDYEIRTPVHRRPTLYPHAPVNLLMLANLPLATNEDNIRKLDISGLAEFKIAENSDFNPRNKTSSLTVLLYFVDQTSLWNFHGLTHREEDFDHEEFKIRGKRVK